MKQRVISALVALLIVIPIIIIGGNPYKIAVIVIGVIGLLELIKLKKTPSLVKAITVFNFLVLMLSNINMKDFALFLDFKYIILSFVSLLLPLVLYHDNKKYNIEDAIFLSFATIFLSICFSLLMIVRSYNVYYLVFILLITITSDTFAYLVGKLIGKNKFSPSISPKKTIEGFMGGLAFSTFITTILYISAFDYNGRVVTLILIMMGLSIISTLGDLVFSSIKRFYEIKDFGKIMPGHGGVLDRLDSLFFVLLTFYLIINFI